MDRNSTSFPLQLAARLDELHKEWKDSGSVLKYYQFVTRAVVVDKDIVLGAGLSRGLLVTHQMGMGKSIVAAAIKASLEGKRQVIIATPKSLQSNLVGAIAKLKELSDAAGTEDGGIGVSPSYISLNANNLLTQLARATSGSDTLMPGSLDGRLLIVDEAHNFFRAIVNGSTNGAQLYEMIMRARDLRIVFLTGTPIVKDPFEIVPCFNMLAGVNLLPVQYSSFISAYVGRDKRIQNKEKLSARLLGLVSHVDPRMSSSPKGIGGKSSTFADQFPEELDIIIERCVMSQRQYLSYLASKAKEEGGKTVYKPKTGEGERKNDDPCETDDPYPHTRITKCNDDNSVADEGNDDGMSLLSMVVNVPDDDEYIANSKQIDTDSDTNNSSKRGGIGGSSAPGSAPMRLPSSGDTGATQPYYALTRMSSNFSASGAESGKAIALSNIKASDISEESSTKFARMMENVKKSKGPIVIYSQFLRSGGLYVIAKYLEKEGYIEYESGLTKGLHYTMISGETQSTRQTEIQNTFNSDENMHGDVIKVLMISEAGSEGLDLKAVRQVHITEPYWNRSREDQVKARAIRLGSHMKLPADERKVQTYIYMSIPNENVREGLPEDERETESIDEQFYRRASARAVTIDDFRQVLREVAIECVSYGWDNCYVCHPSAEQLFSENALTDLNVSTSCVPPNKKSVSIDGKIEIDGIEYHYRREPKKPLGYEFYKYDEKLNTFTAVKSNNPVLNKLLIALEPTGAAVGGCATCGAVGGCATCGAVGGCATCGAVGGCAKDDCQCVQDCACEGCEKHNNVVCESQVDGDAITWVGGCVSNTVGGHVSNTVCVPDTIGISIIEGVELETSGAHRWYLRSAALGELIKSAGVDKRQYIMDLIAKHNKKRSGQLDDKTLDYLLPESCDDADIASLLKGYAKYVSGWSTMKCTDNVLEFKLTKDANSKIKVSRVIVNRLYANYRGEPKRRDYSVYCAILRYYHIAIVEGAVLPAINSVPIDTPVTCDASIDGETYPSMFHDIGDQRFGGTPF
jgi:superfamily II DNA or RNA helicase